MPELLAAIRDLCLMRIGPQDLPWSPTLLGVVVALNVLLDATLAALVGKPGTGLAASAISLVVILGGLAVLLRLAGHANRFTQTALALVASALVFSLLAGPAQLLLSPLPEDPELVTGAQLGAMLVLVTVAFWALAVSAHILRHALERSFGQGLLLALALNISAMFAVVLLLPGAAA